VIGVVGHHLDPELQHLVGALQGFGFLRKRLLAGLADQGLQDAGHAVSSIFWL
jgi:hypothetical protein